MKNVYSIGDESPGILLRRILDYEDRIVNIIVTVTVENGENGDGQITHTWFNSMKNNEMAWMMFVADQQLKETMREES